MSSTIRRRQASLFMAIALTASLLIAAGPAAHAQEGPPPEGFGVKVVHGVPGLVVDIYVNDNLFEPGVGPGDILGPIPLPPDTYEIDIRAAGDPPTADPAISGSATVDAGMSYSLVAHLDAQGTPILTAFVDDTSQIDIGNGRLVVRHTAAAPAVDVLANGAVLVPNLSNPNEAAADVPAANYAVTLNAAGTSTQAFDAGTLPVAADTVTTVYAIGDLAGGSFDLLVDAAPQPAEGATVGLVNPNTGSWAPPGVDPFFYGVPGDTPFLGDWDGDGLQSPGLYRPSEGFAYIRNSNTTGVADSSWFMGNPGDIPLVGDWDGDGVDTVGVIRGNSPGTFFFRNSNTQGVADGEIPVIEADWPPIVASSPAGGPPMTMVADFLRGSVVPGPGDDNGIGIGFVDYDPAVPNEVCFFLEIRNVESPTAAHIHEGGIGESGPVEVDFDIAANPFVPDEFVPARHRAQGCVEVSPSVMAEIFADPEGHYINIHSEAYPAGAIRNQLVDITEVPQAPPPTVQAGLGGDAAVPGPGDPDGFGQASFQTGLAEQAAFITPESGEWCFFMEGWDAGEPTAAHIHAGAEGVAGDVVVDMELDRWVPWWDPIDRSWNLDGCVEVDPAVATAILADPAGYYVNYHTADFPAGAIRGQLGPAFAPPLGAELSGDTAVPGPGDPDGFGFAFLSYDPDGVICYFIEVTGIGTPTAAHIHEGGPGAAGPVVVPFDIATNAFYDPEVPFFDLFARQCVDVDPGVIADIVADPGGYYVNVHTAEFPNGAISGQLFPLG